MGVPLHRLRLDVLLGHFGLSRDVLYGIREICLGDGCPFELSDRRCASHIPGACVLKREPQWPSELHLSLFSILRVLKAPVGAALCHNCRLLKVVLHRVRDRHHAFVASSAREECEHGWRHPFVGCPLWILRWWNNEQKNRPSPSKRHSSLTTAGCCPATGRG